MIPLAAVNTAAAGLVRTGSPRGSRRFSHHAEAKAAQVTANWIQLIVK